MADPTNGKKNGATKNQVQQIPPEAVQAANSPQPASTDTTAPAVSSTQTPMTNTPLTTPPATQPLPGQPVPRGVTPTPLATPIDTAARTDVAPDERLDSPSGDVKDERNYAERSTHSNTPYGSVDLVVPAHPSTYWPSARAMVNEIRQHAATTHGLASDKLLFEKIVAFLTMQLDDAVLDKSSAGAKTAEERAAMAREGRTDGQAKAVEQNKNRMALSDHDQLRAERGQELKHEPPSQAEPNVPLSERATTDAQSAKLHEPPAGLTEPPPPPPNVAGTTA